MSTNEKILHILNIILVAAVIILSIFLHKSCSVEQPEPIVIKDTVTITQFETKIKEVPVYYVDTIRIIDIVEPTTGDTIKYSDTLKIPIESKETSFEVTKDSFELNGIIHYHGYKADIDSVNFDYKFTYTPPVEKKRKWHISLQAGYYTGYNLIDRKIFSGPGAGIGISYDLW